jgi:diaminohydroxyphosphoribosylaminopyrimidine deaminase/5-amino-6-(5-phosphoribosylamino)uracil reductase
MTDARAMAHALALGRRGLGNAWPNPAVGCVIRRGDVVAGRGWTQPGGRPHAETMALAQAGAAARGATAYVTLEPCAHHGHTPPCATALIAAGIARLVCPVEDPDPRVAGRGFAMLRAAGIAVDVGLMADHARADLAGFLLSRTAGRPLVTLKLATSLDGRIATATGHSQWITGPVARRRVHALRLTHDAVMVGAGTARADDPLLTVRDMGALRQPVRVVLSRRLDLPVARLAGSILEAPLWLLHGADAPAAARDAWAARGAGLIEVAVDGRQIDLGAGLAALAAAGLTRILCEGGGQLAAGLLAAGLVDRLAVFTAGLAIGAEGLPAVGVLGLSRLDEAPRWRLRSVDPVGDDTLTVWERA